MAAYGSRLAECPPDRAPAGSRSRLSLYRIENGIEFVPSRPAVGSWIATFRV